MNWPDDVDGDVFRRLQSSGFDFSRQCWIDFNVDFKNWPPSEEAIECLKQKYRRVTIVHPEAGDAGYLEIQIYDHLTYDLVMEQQLEISEMVGKTGAVCESWGVLQE